MTRYPIKEGTRKPYGVPPGVIVNEEGLVIGKKDEFHNKIDEIGQDLIKISQDLIKSCQTKGAYSKELEELKDFPEKKFPELIRIYDEQIDTLKRLQAEFENYKKWNAREKSDFTKYAHADVIAQMLPVLDSFEIALKNTNDKDKFIEGMKIVYAQFYSMLESQGLKPIKATGERFDPYRHEVLMKEESDKPEETILEEFQKGYMLNDKVLRHSKVKVSGK